MKIFILCFIASFCATSLVDLSLGLFSFYLKKKQLERIKQNNARKVVR